VRQPNHLTEKLAHLFVYVRGFQTFSSEVHISYHTKVRVPDILSNVFFSRYVTFYQTSKVFRKYTILSLLTKSLRGPDKMCRRARFGPWAV